MEIISRNDAKDLGLNKYYIGEPCKQGNKAERYVGNKACTCPDCKEQRGKSAKEKFKKDPLYYVANALKKRYGMTLKDYDNMLEKQGGVCEICKTKTPGGHGRFHVDHNHNNGNIRGLLCQQCNTGLGKFGDSPDMLERAIGYIEERGHYG